MVDWNSQGPENHTPGPAEGSVGREGSPDDSLASEGSGVPSTPETPAAPQTGDSVDYGFDNGPDVNSDQWYRLALEAIAQTKKRDVRSIMIWLNQLPDLAPSHLDGIWRALSELDSVTFGRLMVKVSANVVRAGNHHRLAWLCERLVVEAGPLNDPIKAYIEGQGSWEAYVSSLRHVMANALKGVAPKERKAKSLRLTAYALVITAPYQKEKPWAEALLGVIAATLPRGTHGPNFDSDFDGYADAILGASRSKLATRSLFTLLAPIWNEVNVARVKATVESQRAIGLQEGLADTLREAQELKACLTQMEQHQNDLEARLAAQSQELRDALDRYDTLKETSSRTLRQERSGLIHRVRKNVEHDLSEICIALEGRESEREVKLALGRVEGIRRFLQSLEAGL